MSILNPRVVRIFSSRVVRQGHKILRSYKITKENITPQKKKILLKANIERAF